MTTLKDCIEAIQCDATWGIWTKLIEEKFNLESEARYGKINSSFENGGHPNDFEFFANGSQVYDSHTHWKGDFEISDWGEEWDAIIVLWEEKTDTDWGGDRKHIAAWIDEVENEQVAKLINEAEAKWDAQCSEFSTEWIEEFIEEQNQLLEDQD